MTGLAARIYTSVMREIEESPYWMGDCLYCGHCGERYVGQDALWAAHPKSCLLRRAREHLAKVDAPQAMEACR